jgi:hypothetical protein
MSIPIDSQNLESFVPVYDAAPKTWEEGMPFIVEQLKKLANAVNVREIGFFLDQEVLAGKLFIPGVNIASGGGSSQQFRTVLRKVIDFGALPNATFKAVPHGITFDANFTLIQMWASATDPTNLLALPIPFAAVPSANTPIQMFMDSTNIYITTSDNRSSYTRCYIILEFMQEL